MKKFIHTLGLILTPAFLLVLSSCSGGDKDIFRIMPENTTAVITFNPADLMQKGKLDELDVFKKAAGESGFIKKIMSDPGATGIKLNGYSAFFVFDKSPSLGCLVLPVSSASDFNALVNDISKEKMMKMEVGKIGDYSTRRGENIIIAWNNSVAFVLSSLKSWSGTNLDTAAARLTNTKRSECLLTDKDFNKFRSKQKDINAWLTSTHLADMTGIGELGDAIDLFGGLKNNYEHVFVDFQKGSITITSNLRLNASMKETIDKYNFLDQHAQKELLKYLPLKDIFLAGNTNVDPEKLLSLMEFINKQTGNHISEIENEFGLDEKELKKAFQGEIAFSVNGIKKSPALKESDIYGDSSFARNVPVFMGAVRLKNQKAWEVLTEKLKEVNGITKHDGYYSLAEKFVRVFMAEKDNTVILTNSEEYIQEITSDGQIQPNVLEAPFAKILTKDPICIYLNLDSESYSQNMQDYIEENIGDEMNMGMESLGKSLKSLSVTANLEEWEFRLELSNTSDYSLYALLKSF